MSLILLTILVLGTLLTLVAAIIALRAGVRAFIAHLELRDRLASEVESLSRRAGELESRAARLEERTRDLPVRVGRVQENLAALRILTGNLYVSLAQVRRGLSYSGIKSSGTSWLAQTARRRARATRTSPRG